MKFAVTYHKHKAMEEIILIQDRNCRARSSTQSVQGLAEKKF